MNKAQYLYGGNQVNLELTFYQQASIIDKQRKEMNILIYINESIISNISNNQSTIKSKEIICPEFKENCLINFDNYNIKLYNCKKGHEIKKMSFKDFINSQNINEMKLNAIIVIIQNINHIINNYIYIISLFKNNNLILFKI